MTCMYGSGLHLGVGYRYWKLVDVPGTQPPFRDAGLYESMSSHCFAKKSTHICTPLNHLYFINKQPDTETS